MIKKFRLYVDTGFVGGSIEEVIEVETDNFKNEKELEEYLNDCSGDFLSNKIDYGWQEVEG